MNGDERRPVPLRDVLVFGGLFLAAILVLVLLMTGAVWATGGRWVA